MSVQISLDDKRINCISFQWDQWPTNIFSLWFPEAWTFGSKGDRIVVKEACEWRQDGLGVCIGGVRAASENYAIEWLARLTPSHDSVLIELEVANTGEAPLPAFSYASTCLNFLTAPDFMDSTGAATFFRTGDGWQSMEGFRRPQALRRGHDPYHVLMAGCDDPGDAEQLPVRTTSPLCVRTGRDRGYSVGFAWSSCLRLDINFNRLHCIHSVPRIGPLEPSQTRSAFGRIYFHQGDKDDLCAICEADGLV